MRYVGVSNWAAWQIVKALGISERLGLARFESLQAYYTVAGRDLEREIVPMLRSENVGLMVWSPLAGGLLSGKYGRGRDQQGEQGSRRTNFDIPPVDKDRAFDVVDAMRPAQLADNIAATEVKLTADELETLDKVSQLPPEYPGWMLARQGGARGAQMG